MRDLSDGGLLLNEKPDACEDTGLIVDGRGDASKLSAGSCHYIIPPNGALQQAGRGEWSRNGWMVSGLL